MPSLRPLLSFFSIAITLSIAGQISKAQSSDAKARPTGSISGHVTIDGKAAPGIPVAGVAGVTINRRDAAAQAVTDYEGFYLLSGLAGRSIPGMDDYARNDC